MTDGNMELSRRKILGAAGAVGAAGAAAGLGTSALFSDEESFVNNSITAGTLDLKVSWDEHYFNGIRNLDNSYNGDIEFDSPGSSETGFPSSSGSPYLAVADGEVGTFMRDTRTEQFPDGGLGSDEDPCEELADVPGAEIPPPVIDLDDVKPGDFGEVTFDFSLCDNPGYLWMTGDLVSESENGVTEPEGDSPEEDGSFANSSLWPLAALAAVPALGGDDDDSGGSQASVAADKEAADVEAGTSDRRSALRKGAAAAGMGAAGLSAASGLASADSGKGGSQPTDPDGPNDVQISNGILDVTVGELGSGTNVQGPNWNYDDGSLSAGTLYRETYGFRDGTGPHVDAENFGTLVSGYQSSVSAGTTAESTVTIPVETDTGTEVTLEVDRNVTLDPNIATLRVEYEVTNPSTSDATFSDLRLSQYVDYDIGSVSDDVGEYFLDTQTNCEFIFQENSAGLFAGFTAEDLSVNHDLREYPSGEANFQSSDIEFNNDNKFPDSGTDDVTLAFEWSLGQLAPGESTTYETAFVYNPTQEDFEEQLCAESPSTPTPTPTPSPGESELPDKVQARAWYDGGGGDGPSGDVGDNINQDDEQVFLEGTLRQVLDALSSGEGVPLDGDESTNTDFDETSDPLDDTARDCYTAADDVHYIGFEWWVPREVGNEIQSDSVTFDLGFYTEQCRNNDGSGEAPDEDDGDTGTSLVINDQTANAP